jgi:hypothetical protein
MGTIRFDQINNQKLRLQHRIPMEFQIQQQLAMQSHSPGLRNQTTIIHQSLKSLICDL